MDFTKSGIWKAVLAGGIVLALASYMYQVYTKDASEEMNYRPVARDFCLGACATAALYMFLPESIDSLIETTATAVTTSVAAPADIELQTGPARF